MIDRGQPITVLISDVASLSPARSRGLGADRPARAPAFSWRAWLPRERVTSALAGCFLIRSASVQIQFASATPRCADGVAQRVATGALGLISRLSQLFTLQGFLVRPLQQATEISDDAFGDYPYLDPCFRAFLAVSHGDQRIHEEANCFARKTKSSPFGPAQ